MCDSWCFSIEHLYGTTANDRHQSDSKDNYSDTTLPLRKASPKQYPMRKCFDVGQYGRACRRETGHRFEISIRHIIYIPP